MMNGNRCGSTPLGQRRLMIAGTGRKKKHSSFDNKLSVYVNVLAV
jgi:hypothetical protein